MAVIDQNLTMRAVEERLGTEADPVLRRNLETVLRHMRAEAALDIDGLMATVADDAHYHFHNGPAAGEFRGAAAVRRFYEAFGASGCEKLQLDIDRLVVDRDCVVTEGIQRIAFPGATLQARGIDVDDPDALYLFEARCAIVWPFDDQGLLLGEDSYFAGDGFEGIAGRKISPVDIVAYRA
jgi:hypothetical protein